MAAGAWTRLSVLAGLAVAAATLALATPGLLWARAAPPNAWRRYVGATACADCHPGEARSWAAGPHGAPPPEGAGDDARCVACHATGDGPASAERLPGVQCEACHGAGAAYAVDDIMRNPALARELGLRDLGTPAARARACGACHRSRTRVRPFEPERSWREFGHGNRGERAITAPHAGPQR